MGMTTAIYFMSKTVLIFFKLFGFISGASGGVAVVKNL
jgi:hypothetical protein